MSSDWKTYFQGKKITLMGLGLLGRGIGDAAFLAKHGAELVVTDIKSETQLAASLEELKKFPNISYHLGGHDIEDFEGKDMILKAAGVSLDSVFIEHARLHDIPVEMDESLFVKLAPLVTTVGVTGTRGKTTVATLIAHILKSKRKKVHLAGNIRGIATLPFLEKVKEGDIVVMELSSWQLQGFGESRMSPHIAVFTNFLDDHLNYYGGSRDLYFYDKSNIFRYQKENDIIIVGPQAKEFIEDYTDYKGKLVGADPSIIPPDWKLPLLGTHNRENIACAMLVCEALGIPIEKQKKSVESFQPVTGRLEYLGTLRGFQVYNDNNATTPDATIAAIDAVGDASIDHPNIVLIAGGADKGLTLSRFAEKIRSRCRSAVLLSGTGTDKFKNLLSDDPPVFVVSSIEEALNVAFQSAHEGDIILFSPGFSSFGMFKNEYDRNDQFLVALGKYEKENA